LAACGGGEHQAHEGEALPTVSVSAVTADEAAWPASYEAVGTVRARVAATVSAKVMGYVREVQVDAGDRVHAGQSLITIDSRDLDAGLRRSQAGLNEAKSAMSEVDSAISAAGAQLELAQATFRRMTDLHDKNSITEQEFDEASARLRMAEANVEMAQSKKSQLTEKIQQAQEAVASAEIMKSYAEITAPFEGTVTNKMVEPGNLTAPGAPLLTIEQAGSYRLEARVEESRLPSIRTGDEVEVELDALSETLTARVSEIVPAVDASSRAFLVRINLPNRPNLRSGLFGRARFATGEQSAVVVPEDAVVSRGQVRLVYAIEGGHARGRLVTLGQTRDGMVEVLSGLAGGERIVSPASLAMTDGSPVEVHP
jgi:RND family efflux transporter MFP subunit